MPKQRLNAKCSTLSQRIAVERTAIGWSISTVFAECIKHMTRSLIHIRLMEADIGLRSQQQQQQNKMKS